MTTETVELLEIKREMAQLDEEFTCEANVRTGRIKLLEYNQRHTALRKRLAEAELAAKRDAQLAARRPPPRPSAPKPRRYVMPAGDARKLKETTRALERALEAGDEAAVLETLQSDELHRLMMLDELADAQQFHGNGYAAAVAVRASLAIKYVSLLGLRDRRLESRIKELETAIPRYCGVYRSGETYMKNNLVSMGGSMWIALKDTTTKPPSDDWQCCVQRGRDGGRN